MRTRVTTTRTGRARGDEVEALPGAEGEAAAEDRDVERGADEAARAAGWLGTMWASALARSERTSGSAFSLIVSACDPLETNRLTTPAAASRSSGTRSYRAFVQMWIPAVFGSSVTTRRVHAFGGSWAGACRIVPDEESGESNTARTRAGGGGEERRAARGAGRRARGAGDARAGGGNRRDAAHRARRDVKNEAKRDSARRVS